MACPQGLDPYLCALQQASVGTDLKSLREDVLSMSKAMVRGCTSVEAGGRGTIRFRDGRGWGPSVPGEDRASGTLNSHILAWSSGLGVQGDFQVVTPESEEVGSGFLRHGYGSWHRCNQSPGG